jgi:anti-sigma factor RsiW
MRGSDHPAHEDLLLLQSGELNPAQARTVEQHLANCRACHAEFSGLESLYRDVAGAETSRQTPSATSNKRRRTSPGLGVLSTSWPAALASTTAVALVVVLLLEMTPAARADELLSRAVRQQAALSRPQGLQLESGSGQCYVALDASGTSRIADAVAPLRGQSAVCEVAASRLRSAGWAWDDLLSAESFRRWRGSLSRKADSIRELPRHRLRAFL